MKNLQFVRLPSPAPQTQGSRKGPQHGSSLGWGSARIVRRRFRRPPRLPPPFRAVSRSTRDRGRLPRADDSAADSRIGPGS